MIRTATADDVSDILRLIRALADYEREPDAVEVTEQTLAAALFDAEPLARALVAEAAGRVVGIAVWYLAFSTWTGRPTLYLEDIFVEESHRGTGLGRQLMAALAAEARRRDCGRMDWSVLNWNEPSIGFYRALGARPLSEWTGWRLEGDGLERLAAG